jgi:hypothetical protein
VVDAVMLESRSPTEIARLHGSPAYVGEPVKLQFVDDYVRVVGRDGSLIRELVLDAGRDNQPRLQSSTMT